MNRKQRREALAKKLGVSARGKSLRQLQQLTKSRGGRPVQRSRRNPRKSAEEMQEEIAAASLRGVGGTDPRSLEEADLTFEPRAAEWDRPERPKRKRMETEPRQLTGSHLRPSRRRPYDEPQPFDILNEVGLTWDQLQRLSKRVASRVLSSTPGVHWSHRDEFAQTVLECVLPKVKARAGEDWGRPFNLEGEINEDSQLYKTFLSTAREQRSEFVRQEGLVKGGEIKAPDPTLDPTTRESYELAQQLGRATRLKELMAEVARPILEGEDEEAARQVEMAMLHSGVLEGAVTLTKLRQRFNIRDLATTKSEIDAGTMLLRKAIRRYMQQLTDVEKSELPEPMTDTEAAAWRAKQRALAISRQR